MEIYEGGAATEPTDHFRVQSHSPTLLLPGLKGFGAPILMTPL